MSGALTTLCLLLSSLSVFAAGIAVGDLDAGPATHAKAPAVANSAHGSFLIWLDSRRYRWLEVTTDLYGSRIDASGHLEEPFGRPLAFSVSSALVSSNGAGYVIVFSAGAENDAFALPLEENGNPRGDPIAIGRGSVQALTSNGVGYCALLSSTAVVMDGDGKPSAVIPVSLDRTPSLIVFGKNYELIQGRSICGAIGPCSLSLRLTQFDPATQTATEHTILDAVAASSCVSAIGIDDRVLVAVRSDNGSTGQRSIELLLADGSGNVITPPHVLESERTFSNDIGGQPPALVADGRKVLVAWIPAQVSRDLPQVLGLRVTNDGTPIDSSPFVVTPPIGGAFAVAQTGALTAAWTEFHEAANTFNMFGHIELHVAVFASIDAIQATEGDVVESAAMQNDSTAVASGPRALVVWREYDQPSAIRAAALDVQSGTASHTITVGAAGGLPQYSPAAAAIGDVALVAWNQEDVEHTYVFGRRVTLDGTLLDPGPILIATIPAGRNWSGGTPVAVATDGSQFLVAWISPDQIYAARVRVDGTVVDGNPIQVSHEASTDSPFPPRLRWTGDGYLVTWMDYRRNPIPDLILPPYATARSTIVKPTGEVAGETQTIFQGLGFVQDFDVAIGDSTSLLAYSVTDDESHPANTICTYTRVLDKSGKPLSSDPALIGCDELPSWRVYSRHASLAWTGRSFVLAWANQSSADVRMIEVSRTGVPAGPVSLTVPFSNTFDATILWTSFGILETHTQVGDQSQFAGSQRTFVQVLPSVPRRRSAHH